MIENVAVKIVDGDSRRTGAHETVQRLVEEGHGGGDGNLMGQIPPERAFTGNWIIRFSDAGEKKQPRIIQSPGSEKNQIGGLKILLPAGAGVKDSGGAALFLYDAPHPSARLQAEIRTLRQHGQERIGGLRLGAD